MENTLVLVVSAYLKSKGFKESTFMPNSTTLFKGDKMVNIIQGSSENGTKSAFFLKGKHIITVEQSEILREKDPLLLYFIES
jgi:hypothetical protein